MRERSVIQEVENINETITSCQKLQDAENFILTLYPKDVLSPLQSISDL